MATASKTVSAVIDPGAPDAMISITGAGMVSMVVPRTIGGQPVPPESMSCQLSDIWTAPDRASLVALIQQAVAYLKTQRGYT